jgi:nickel-dependent lactate racemase
MHVELPWGTSSLGLDVPDTWNLIHPKPAASELPAPGDELDLVAQALARPEGAAPLDSRALAGKRILIVVDDNTRPTPARRFMHLVLEALQAAGAALGEVLVMPALGIHSPMSAEEMAAKIGAANLARVRWQNHDAFDDNQLGRLGQTTRGTAVVLNRAVLEADLVVSVGMVEPHLWAGFGGGMKNILPGLAGAVCIGEHHAIIAEPPYHFNRVGCPPERNSFRLDLEETQGMLKAEVFCLNVCLDHHGGIAAAFAGDPIAAHRRAVAFNRRFAGCRLERQVDAVMVNSYPMDFNFKQSMKGVGNALPALKPGGLVMGFLRAERGLDDIVLPAKGKPLWLVKRILRFLGPARVMGFLEKVRPGLNVEEKFLLYYSMQLIRQYDLYFHVPTLTPEETRRLGFFRPFARPQEVVDRARRRLPAGARVAVFTAAGATFPIVGNDEN